jgi:hypothetical protein
MVTTARLIPASELLFVKMPLRLHGDAGVGLVEELDPPQAAARRKYQKRDWRAACIGTLEDSSSIRRPQS